MDAEVIDLVRRLHGCDRRVALAVTGGGATAAAWLLGVPGGSRTVLEVCVPYAQEALDDYLGRPPESYCSAQTARLLARRARDRAAWLAPGTNVVGLGCTASLRSDRPKKGDHRIHVAAVGACGTCRVASLTLTKDARDREGEEEVAARMVLDALAWAFALPDRPGLPLLPGEHLEEAEEPDKGALAALVRGEAQAVCAEPDGRLRMEAPPPRALLPGSFNPLHEGHLRMAAAASRRLGGPVAFELSAVNADKPPLEAPELRRRAGQFAGRSAVWLTRAPTFVEKSRLFGGVTFVVGADTAVRVVQPRYYDGSEEAMRRALAELRQRGCRFLVAGRADGGAFVSLGQLAIPEEFRDLFEGIPEEEFRHDVSSTAIRGRQ
jgi:hypothetical protein